MMKKFGGWLDEDDNVWVGGTTLCECCTYCLKCKKNPNSKKKKKQEAAIDDGDPDFEPEGEDGDQKQKIHARAKTHKKRSCFVVCCRAIFCCSTTNTVSREVELADLRKDIGDGSNEETGLLQKSGDKLSNDDGTNVDPAGSDAENNALLQDGGKGEKGGGANGADADAGSSEEIESEAESSVPEDDG